MSSLAVVRHTTVVGADPEMRQVLVALVNSDVVGAMRWRC